MDAPPKPRKACAGEADESAAVMAAAPAAKSVERRDASGAYIVSFFGFFKVCIFVDSMREATEGVQETRKGELDSEFDGYEGDEEAQKKKKTTMQGKTLIEKTRHTRIFFRSLSSREKFSSLPSFPVFSFLSLSNFDAETTHLLSRSTDDDGSRTGRPVCMFFFFFKEKNRV